MTTMILTDYLNQKFPRDGFARNVLDLMTGAVLAQVIYATISPILTRLYSPEEFGALALFTSIVMVVVVVFSWRYDLAVVLPEKKEDAANLLFLSILIAVIMTGISVVVIAYFHNQISNLLGMPSLAPWLRALPICLLAMGIYQPLNSWCVRKKQFKAIAASRIGQAGTTAGVQTGSGIFYSLGISGLIGGYIIGSLVPAVILGWIIIKEDAGLILRSLSRQRIKANALRYKKYPMFSTWSAFVNMFSLALPVFFITHYFDANTVGQYALSFRVLQVPLALIGASIGRVYFQRLAKEKNESGDISGTVEKTFKRLMLMAVPGCLFLMALAPNLFDFIFGSDWRTAGEFTQILALAMAMRFVTSPLTTVFGVSNRQEIAAIWQVSQLVSTALFLFGSLYFESPLATILALAINDTLLYLVYLIIVFRIAKASFHRALNFRFW